MGILDIFFYIIHKTLPTSRRKYFILPYRSGKWYDRIPLQTPSKYR